MKDKVVRFAKWAQKNWLALIIFLSVLMMLFLCAVMFSWLYGYWSNALRGTRFELQSCWTGVTVVCTGVAGIVSLGKACWTKYGLDSKYNSEQGKPLASNITNTVSTMAKKG